MRAQRTGPQGRGPLLDRLAAWVAAFPSSDVAVSVTATVAALGEWRQFGYALLDPTALLVLGSVYGQFHYVVDALARRCVAAAGAVGGLIPNDWVATGSEPAGGAVSARRLGETEVSHAPGRRGGAPRGRPRGRGRALAPPLLSGDPGRTRPGDEKVRPMRAARL